MKVLIVCSGNAEKFNFKLHQAFVYEQIESIKKIYKIEYDTFFIKGNGFVGYLKNLPLFRKKMLEFNPDLIHAHYGLSGLLSCLQFKKPLIVTFHNGEILSQTTNILASMVTRFSKFDIYVAQHIRRKMYFKKNRNYAIIPCGIDLESMKVLDDKYNTHHLLDPIKRNILFGGSFDNERKNSVLAKKAISLLNDLKINLIELKGLTKDEVNILLNLCDLALLPSSSEGSPQFIKEAMACNCPIVATDVGDIKEVIGETPGCFITSSHPSDVAEKITLALQFNKRTNGREMIKEYDNCIISEKIFNIYQKVLSK